MEQKKFSKPLDESIGSSIRHYVNMQIDRAAMKGAEKMSWVSNKVIVTAIFIIAGSIILLFLGIALALLLGQAMGNYALGFLCIAAAVLILTLIVFLLRNKLFANKMSKMYTKMLLGDDKVSDLNQLHLRQQLMDQQIEDREEAFAQEYRMFKQMINPLTYINQFVSKVREAFRKEPNVTESSDDMEKSNTSDYQSNQF